MVGWMWIPHGFRVMCSLVMFTWWDGCGFHLDSALCAHWLSAWSSSHFLPLVETSSPVGKVCCLSNYISPVALVAKSWGLFVVTCVRASGGAVPFIASLYGARGLGDVCWGDEDTEGSWGSLACSPQCTHDS